MTVEREHSGPREDIEGSPPEDQGPTTKKMYQVQGVQPVGGTPTRTSGSRHQRDEPGDGKGGLKGQPRKVTTRGQWPKGDVREEF